MLWPKLWPNKCYLMRIESTNGPKKNMADGRFGGWHNTNEFVPENCGIINGLAYKLMVY